LSGVLNPAGASDRQTSEAVSPRCAVFLRAFSLLHDLIGLIVCQIRCLESLATHPFAQDRLRQRMLAALHRLPLVETPESSPSPLPGSSGDLLGLSLSSSCGSSLAATTMATPDAQIRTAKIAQGAQHAVGAADESNASQGQDGAAIAHALVVAEGLTVAPGEQQNTGEGVDETVPGDVHASELGEVDAAPSVVDSVESDPEPGAAEDRLGEQHPMQCPPLPAQAEQETAVVHEPSVHVPAAADPTHPGQEEIREDIEGGKLEGSDERAKGSAKAAEAIADAKSDALVQKQISGEQEREEIDDIRGENSNLDESFFSQDSGVDGIGSLGACTAGLLERMCAAPGPPQLLGGMQVCVWEGGAGFYDIMNALVSLLL
jgi:hypothetical protein